MLAKMDPSSNIPWCFVSLWIISSCYNSFVCKLPPPLVCDPLMGGGSSANSFPYILCRITCPTNSGHSIDVGELLVEWTLDVTIIWGAKYHMNVLSGFLFLYSLSSTYHSLFPQTQHVLTLLGLCICFTLLTLFLLCKWQTPSLVQGFPSAITPSAVPSPLGVVPLGATCGWLPLPGPSTAQTVLQFLQFLFSCLSPQFTCEKFKQRLDFVHLSNLGIDLFIFAMIEVFNMYSLD